MLNREGELTNFLPLNGKGGGGLLEGGSLFVRRGLIEELWYISPPICLNQLNFGFRLVLSKINLSQSHNFTHSNFCDITLHYTLHWSSDMFWAAGSHSSFHHLSSAWESFIQPVFFPPSPFPFAFPLIFCKVATQQVPSRKRLLQYVRGQLKF